MYPLQWHLCKFTSVYGCSPSPSLWRGQCKCSCLCSCGICGVRNHLLVLIFLQKSVI